MRACSFAVLAACSGVIAPSAQQPLQSDRTILIDTGPKELRRMVPPEAYLRAYMMWFGGLAPKDIEQRAHVGQLFDTWADYLAALGLPEHKRDLPRQEQTNTLMISTFGRLAEALCVRAAERDLHAHPAMEARVIFKFDSARALDQAGFAQRFELLHRKFLGYPTRLAPADRVTKFYNLYRSVEQRRASEVRPMLAADEVAWVAVCVALVQHPEAGLY